MPAGVPMSRYIAFFTASMLSMLAGAQVVHYFYKPLDGLEEAIQQALEKQRNQKSESDSSNKI